MKKITPYLFGLSAAGLTILLAGTVSYTLMPPGSSLKPELDIAPQDAHALATEVLEAKCAACHGENPGYSKVMNALSGGLIKEDIEKAQRAFTIAPASDVRSGNVDYLKMDYVLRSRRMPPVRYTAVHPGAGLSADELAVLRARYPQEGAMVRMFHPILPPSFGMEADDTLRPIIVAMSLTEDGRLSLSPKAILGHRLFFDTRLSTSNTVSCATCHDLTKGGTDNKPKSEGVPGPDGKPLLGGVNAPSVYNAAGNIRQFWDGRAANLAEQAGGPPLNPMEMGYSSPEDWANIAEKLAQDPQIVAMFRAVYGDAGITGETITDAIAEFEKYLVTPGSAFDKYLMGDADALSPEQKAGMKAFASYGCATCHSGPNLGGISFEHVNTHAPLRAHAEGYKEGAHGLTDFTGDAKHHDMFRVPNLRNVALTAPYFHTGTVDKLEDAVRIMFQTQVGTEPSDSTIRNVTEFLKAQTGELGGKPLDQLKPEDVAPIIPVRKPVLPKFKVTVPLPTPVAPAPKQETTEDPAATVAPAEEEKSKEEPEVLELPREVQGGEGVIIRRKH